MTDILDFPDNLVLHLERDRRSYKVFTTDKRGYFKVLGGLSDRDTIIDTSYINERQAKQLLVDNIINGYELKMNLMFKQGFYGVVKELAKEREEQLKTIKVSAEELPPDEISVEVLDESKPETDDILKDLDEKLDEITEKYF